MSKRIKPKIVLRSETTIRTFMIGTISLLEEAFGEYWGHFKEDDEELTDEEYDLEGKFLEIRERILDLGNDLIEESKREKVKIKRKIYG